LSSILSTGWANSLGAGPMDGAKGFMFFICNIELTESGLGESNSMKMKPSIK
jgi:insulysin